MKRTPMLLALATVLCAMLMAALRPAAAASANSPMLEPWDAGKHWMMFRIGYQKSLVAEAADGSVGGGVGYSQMLGSRFLRKFSFGGSVQFEQVGRFGAAAEMNVPVTLELDRHFPLSTSFVPYVGFGGGAYYRKLYRTGADIGVVRSGGFVALGANLPVARTGVMGVDVRFTKLDASNGGDNPVFGPGDDSAWQLGAKLQYALVY